MPNEENISDDDVGYTGRCEVFVPDALFKGFKKKGIDVGEAFQNDEDGKTVKAELVENEFVILKSDQSLKKNTSWKSGEWQNSSIEL